MIGQKFRGCQAADLKVRPTQSPVQLAPVTTSVEPGEDRESIATEAGRQWTPLAVVLGLVPLLSWAWIVAMARDMYGPMTGASHWMMSPDWDALHTFLLWAMWAVMMAAMMLPSAAPMMLFYTASARRNGDSGVLEIYALAAGYLAVWTAFSAAVTAVQRALTTVLLVSPMMELTSRRAGAIFLAIAGLYQLTPFKRACLDACHSPLGFLMRHWRSGIAGAFRLGLRHGAYCVGCCWALMLLLFVGGVMNLLVIAALTAFVAFEKLAPFGPPSVRISGGLLIAMAAWLALN
jgi:predicted metal-binding membrane protein